MTAPTVQRSRPARANRTRVRRREPPVRFPAPVILLVEDERPVRQLLRRGLEAHGFRVLEATDAATGIARCADSLPDLVILELGLPDRDGRELIAEVRAWSRVPILVLSARTATADKVAAFDLGGSDYVVKPFHMAE